MTTARRSPDTGGRGARRFQVRPSLVALLTTLVGVAVVPYPASPAAADCAAPFLTIDRAADASGRIPLVRGQEVTVEGRAFVDGCDDGSPRQRAPGCSGDDAPEIEKPMEDVELVVLQGQPTMEQTSLGTADAGTAADNQLGWVTWTFTVPETLELGPAVIKTEGSEPIKVKIVE